MGCAVNDFLSIYKVYQGWGLQRRGPSDPPKENGCKFAPTAPIVSFSRCFLWSKRLSPNPSVSNLSFTLCRYLSMVTRSSSQGSVDDFRRRTLGARDFSSVCFLGGIWRRLEPLERIYGRFPSVDSSGHFTGVPNLGKPYI